MGNGRWKIEDGFAFRFAAILFNPVFKISFHRTEWNVVNIIFAAVLILTIFREEKPLTLELKSDNFQASFMMLFSCSVTPWRDAK